MSLLASGIRAVRERISEKLGVCPFCMRASALGSIAAWSVYWLSGWLVPGLVAPAPIRFLLPLVAWSFTLLIASHLTAYMVRTARYMRSREAARVVAVARPFAGEPMSRRDFMKTVLAAGAYAATIAVLGHVPSFGQATCAGKHDVDLTIHLGIGGSEAIAREEYDLAADSRCDNYCSSFPCVGGCVRSTSAPRVRTPPECKELTGGGWQCTGKVKQCNCTCDKCFGDHSLNRVHGQDYAQGIGASAASAETDMMVDARKKCDKECERYKDCPTPQTCKRNGDPEMEGQFKWGGLHGHQRVKRCKCHCAP
jgi:TAT (twin-arginine translocation) pathway signal sequence